MAGIFYVWLTFEDINKELRIIKRSHPNPFIIEYTREVNLPDNDDTYDKFEALCLALERHNPRIGEPRPWRSFFKLPREDIPAFLEMIDRVISTYNV